MRWLIGFVLVLAAVGAVRLVGCGETTGTGGSGGGGGDGDGGGWFQQNSGTEQALSDVSFTDANNGTVVGRNGTILRTTDGGATWTTQSGAGGPGGAGGRGGSDLLAVSFTLPNIGTAVGSAGTILRTTDGGATWMRQESGTTATLTGVSFTDANHGTAVGYDPGTILRTTDGGATWTRQESGTELAFSDVSFTNANTGTLVDLYGIILRTADGGATWMRQESGTKATLFGVSFTDANHGTAVGDHGTILRTTDGGATWSEQESGVLFALRDVSFLDTNNGIAVGLFGIVVRTMDGGGTWLTQDSRTLAHLSGVSLLDENTASAVGEGGTILRTTDGGGEVFDAIDVEGTWEVIMSISSDSCGATGSYVFSMAVTQEGNTLIGENQSRSLYGKIFGNRLQMRGSPFEGIGSPLVTATVSEDGDTMEGSHKIEYRDGIADCVGSGPFRATRGGTAECVDNVCPCTEQGIREAIAQGGGPRTFDCEGPTTVLTEAEIVIDNDVILDGEGRLTVNGAERHRVFSVPQDVEAELHGFTVTGGYSLIVGPPGGGGIANEGTLVVQGCFILGNHVNHEGPSTPGGGGIWNAGQMTIANSTVADNSANHAAGGGIYNDRSGTLTLMNSTVASNEAGISGSGSVSAVENDGQMIIVNSTVSGNRGVADFGDSCGVGITSTGRLFLINSTISDNDHYFNNSGDDLAIIKREASRPDPHVEIAHTLIDGECTNTCFGNPSNATWVFHGYNIESPDDTCGFDPDGTDQVNVSAEDLKLGPLQDNGGPTETHALLSGFLEHSVAIDVIPEEDCVDADGAPLTTDQRGFPRPVPILGADAKCDVGAFEVQP